MEDTKLKKLGTKIIVYAQVWIMICILQNMCLLNNFFAQDHPEAG